RAGAATVVLDALAEVARQRVPVDQLQEEELGIEVGDDDRRAMDVAGFGRNADGAALLDDDLSDRRIGLDRDAERRAGLRHRPPPPLSLVGPPSPPMAWPHGPFLPFTSPSTWGSST